MTITLSKEELEQFQFNLHKWYREMSNVIMIKASDISRDSYNLTGNPNDKIRAEVERWEKNNPMPDWRSLL